MPMNWRSVDLNLFFVFDAVARERNITRASHRLNISQSAVSHALARLRKALKDELFVRTAEGMEPTSYANTLIDPIQTTLSVLTSVLTQNSVFDPKTSDSIYRIAVDNCNAIILAPHLAAAAAAQAPSVTLDVRPSGTLDIFAQLEFGELDLAIGNIADPSGRLVEEALFDDGFVAIARQAHPAVAEAALTIEALSMLQHLRLSSTGEDDSFIDLELDRHHLVRHVAVRAPLLSATALLMRSDMIAIVSARTARAFVTGTPSLTVLDLPFATPRRRTAMLWHRRTNESPSHRWLRALVRAVAADRADNPPQIS